VVPNMRVDDEAGKIFILDGINSVTYNAEDIET
jgi:hypothetical protein